MNARDSLNNPVDIRVDDVNKGILIAPANTAAQAVTILNTASLSNALDLGAGRAAAIVLPAAFAWTAAGLSALVSHDGITYQQLFDETDTLWTIAAGSLVAGRTRALPLTLFLPFRWVKFQSGTVAVPTAQGADRVMQLIVN